jgi:endonuclease G
MPMSKMSLKALCLSLGVCITFAFSVRGSAAKADDYPHLRMGIPSQATADESKKDNFLMKKDFYALSYNDAKRSPNWVSWRVTADDLGDAPRFAFKPDSTLPAGFTKITTKEYTGSFFNRGHMCPHSDRNKDIERSKSTFVMTNIVPQTSNLNQKAWNQMEVYLRGLVTETGKVLYIVSGPVGHGGKDDNGTFKTTIGPAKVAVPAATWKVVLVLDKDVDDASKITESTHIRLIGAVMPNDPSPGDEWGQYRKSIQHIEELTDLKFFENVKFEGFDDIKAEADQITLPPPVPAHHGNNC